jgi:hypothetical protein
MREAIIKELSGQEDGANEPLRRAGPAQQLKTRPLEKDDDDVDGREWLFEAQRGGTRWLFLIRALRRGGERNASRQVYVVRAYAPAARFAALEKELTAMLDSVKFSR